VYENTFDREDALKDWAFEGPGRCWIQDGHMCMTSHAPDKGLHIVNWNRQDFPADFMCEWDFRRTVDTGLCILFFCAKGVNGEDVFDPKLAPRDGTFKLYTNGDINCYHISYYACGRDSANLRKNHGFYLAAIGPDLVTPKPLSRWQTITLYKRGPQVRLAVDGRLSIAFDDDGRTYGPVWGAGKIGLRQMAHTHTAMYDNFRVWRIAD
jgi:hypothetical protein